MFLTRQKIIIPPKKQLSLALWLLLFDQWTFCCCCCCSCQNIKSHLEQKLQLGLRYNPCTTMVRL